MFDLQLLPSMHEVDLSDMGEDSDIGTCAPPLKCPKVDSSSTIKLIVVKSIIHVGSQFEMK